MRRTEKQWTIVALLVTMVFGVIDTVSAETRIKTFTLVDENFSKGITSINKYVNYKSNSPSWTMGGSSTWTAGALAFLSPGYVNAEQYGYFDFGYGYENIVDNWTLEFDYDYSNVPFSFSEIAVVGENTDITGGSWLGNDAYLSFLAVYTNQSNGTEVTDQYGVDVLRRMRMKVAGTEADKTQLFRDYVHVTMECTHANTSEAELVITLECSVFDTYVIRQKVDGAAIGMPRGFYCYATKPSNDQGAPLQVLFDNIKLTTQKEVEVVKCAVPEISVTGFDGTSRKMSVSCATAGAEIYYSETQLGIGDEGWMAYTGEVTTSATTFYAYAIDPVNEDTTEVVSCATGAGTRARLMPQIVKLRYEAGKGYAFTIDPNLNDPATVTPPSDYTIMCTIDGNEQDYNDGDILYVAEGGLVYVTMTATGYRQGIKGWQTVAYPDKNVIWSEDLIGKIEAAGVGTQKLPLTLSSNKSFEQSYKSFYSIDKVGDTNISIDSRLTLTTDSVFYMQRADAENGGLLSEKHAVAEMNSSDGELTEEEIAAEEAANLSRYEGMGIQGLSGGEYVFIRTNGNEPELMSGNAKLVSGASTRNEYIYQMYSEGGNLYVTLPYGTYVTSVAVRSDKELITTNEYGYAAYITDNALDFSDMPSEFKAEIVTAEETSGNFTYIKVLDAPAGDAVIITGTPNKTYLVPVLSSAEGQGNMLKYSETAVGISNVEKPVYVVDLTTGKMQKITDKSQPIAARTPYIISALDETVYRHYTMSSSGRLSIYSDKALDFSGVEGLKAYALRSETPDSVRLVEITQLPAHMGAILEGAAYVEYDVPEVPTASISYDNLFVGSEETPFPTTSTVKAVYALNKTTGKVETIDKSEVPSIPAGEAYYVSKYTGFEIVTTNGSGAATHVSTHALDMKDVVLRAYVAVEEVSEDSVRLQPVEAVPAGTAFLLMGGQPNHTYKVPYREGEVTIGTNLFRAGPFDVSTTNYYVYGLLENGSQLKHVDPTSYIPAGTAYVLSAYEIPTVVTCAKITVPSGGATTFTTDYALDFSGIEGIEALICDTVDLVEGPHYVPVTAVPANTAFFVKGEAGVTYKVPIGDCETLSYNNVIRRNDTGYYVETGSTFVYTVVNGEITRVSDGTTIAKGQAYIVSPWRGYETVKISASGYATYVTKQPLDFTSLSGEVIVRIVDREEYNNIHTVEVLNVPEKTPILLAGTPGATYNIPVGKSTQLFYNNLLSGSSDDPFDVSTTDKVVYVVSGGRFLQAARTLVIPKGKAYLKSKYKGFEEVKTSASGHVSYVCEHALDLTDVLNDTVAKFSAYIADYETPRGIHLVEVVKVPAGGAFFIKGKPNTTYRLPYANESVEYESGSITCGSRTEGFDVSTVGDSMVYALQDGVLTKVSKGVEIPAGKAYVKSKYLGFEEITIGKSQCASYVCEHALSVEDYGGEVQILVCDYVSESGIHLRSVKEVPAGTAFFVKTLENVDSTCTYRIPFSDCEVLECDNLVRGSLTDEFDCSTADGYVYVLNSGEFIKAASTLKIPARKGYIVTDLELSAAEAKRAVSFDEEEATAIDEVKSGQTAVRPSRRVNLAGQEVDDSYKGIVIDENGKKYLQR